VIVIELNIIQEYKILTEEIAVAKSHLTRAKRDLKKQMETYKPNEAKGIDYSVERVQTSAKEQDIMCTANNICVLTNLIKELEEELKELYKQRQELEDTINSLGDIEKQYIMYKTKDPRMPVWKIAQKLHIGKASLYRKINKVETK
jgi:DNA-binding NtrC family response regulator